MVTGAADFDAVDAGAGPDVVVAAGGFPPTPRDIRGDDVGPDPTPMRGCEEPPTPTERRGAELAPTPAPIKGPEVGATATERSGDDVAPAPTPSNGPEL